ncbi:MAG: NADPH-dependent oxidoreductase, partial [Sphingomicrobium sp.]
VGWTIPSAAACYWVGEAMHKVDFKDLPKVPEEVEETVAMLASNAAHLAKLLSKQAYPGVSQPK